MCVNKGDYCSLSEYLRTVLFLWTDLDTTVTCLTVCADILFFLFTSRTFFRSVPWAFACTFSHASNSTSSKRLREQRVLPSRTCATAKLSEEIKALPSLHYPELTRHIASTLTADSGRHVDLESFTVHIQLMQKSTKWIVRKARRKLTKRETLQVRRKEKDRITDTWGSIISSSCLWSRDRAWPAGVSCPLAGVRSSAYTLALNQPPQIYP